MDHNRIINLLTTLNPFNHVRVARMALYEVSDDSMSPQFKRGERVSVDRWARAMHGDIVVVESDESVSLRELNVRNGLRLLVPFNRKYPTISLADYQSLFPGTCIAGVVDKRVLLQKRAELAGGQHSIYPNHDGSAKSAE